MLISDKFRKTCSGLLALYLIGLGIFLTGFASDHWTTNGPINTGLWRSCYRLASDSTFVCDRLEVDDYPGWLKAVVACMILSLIIAVIGGVTYMFVPLSASLQIASGAFGLIATIIYAGYQSHNGLIVAQDLSWSWALALVGSVMILINGMTLLILMSEEPEFTMEKIMPRDRSIKVGDSERYPSHIYH